MKQDISARCILPALIITALALSGCGGGGGGSNPTISEPTISGTVYQSDGTTPLAGATVALDGNASESTTTSSTGTFSLTVDNVISEGAHNLVVEISSGGSLGPVYSQQVQVTSRTVSGVKLTVPSTTPPPPPPINPSAR